MLDPTPADIGSHLRFAAPQVAGWPQRGLSVVAQLSALRDYAKKNGYIVAREYVDEAESRIIYVLPDDFPERPGW